MRIQIFLTLKQKHLKLKNKEPHCNNPIYQKKIEDNKKHSLLLQEKQKI